MDPDSTSPKRFDHLRLGRHGEDRAAQWYASRGYVVLARNWSCSDGELDLIVSSGREIVFCEVKTRSSERFGSPLEAVNHAKQVKIRTLAMRWPPPLPAVRTVRRFRLVAVHFRHDHRGLDQKPEAAS